ncbi:MAG: DEAD/DEAH box helicase [Planctomycetaceae bacterium]
MAFFGFHPLIEQWFSSRFEEPTLPQIQGWPPIIAGGHTLIAAPTGSGKTLTAFLACIDRLLRESLEHGLNDEIRVVYVSPLRALSNDMHRNLETPLDEINALAAEHHPNATPIRAGLRTGDTTSSERAKLLRKPPHILVTTPESLFLLLTAEKGREKLRQVETVIVDEIHALVRDKRGSHLSLTLERLDALTEKPLQRIGLSATQKPIERTADFLVGTGTDFTKKTAQPDCETDEEPDCTIPDLESRCTIVDTGHQRDLDLGIEIPASELGAVCMHEQWAEVNERIVELIQQHRSTLIFVNTRRLAERVTYQLTELLGEDQVSSHHGSLSANTRLKTEQRLKNGQLKAVVATASLELGLDIGYIDLVIQIGSPRSIATFLQRIGRSGHSLGLTPKGRLFALTRDEAMECMALMRAVRSGRLDAIPIPVAPLDVLAQQIVAEVAAEDWDTDELFRRFRRAAPYRTLKRRDFDRVVEYLSEGITKATGRSRVYLHHDHVGKKLRARKGARIAATSNAGAIPEIASFRVVAEPEQTVVGSLDEDFAIESMAGDVFLLGNTSWRIQYVRGGDVTVIDAQGAPPTIPFWFGEAPGRTLELSEEVSRLREDLEREIAPSLTGLMQNGTNGATQHSPDDSNPVGWLMNETGCGDHVARQIVEYAKAQKAAIGLLPTQKRVVFERFFDESGGMQIVVHAPFGAEINRAWGLSMRKRFCRSYDFELQATADDEGFILSIGPQHSFPLESLFPMLTSQNARDLLEQAVLAVPMFQLRWRWNVTRSLLVLRRQMGKKVPPALQRFRADDLLTACFPRLTGCQEEHTGDIPIPDHPLVQQTLEDCLHEAVNVEGLLNILREIERGDITLVARDTREPSPFSYELLNSNPYAFLDGGEIQERRARAVSTRRSLTVESVNDLGRLDPAAIQQVREEATPFIRSADELHDVLLSRIVLPTDDPLLTQPALNVAESDFSRWYGELESQGRATTITLDDQRTAWVPTERVPAAKAVYPNSRPQPAVRVPTTVKQDWQPAEARVAIVRGLMEICGPITTDELARRVHINESQAQAALEALEGEGLVLRGRFTPSLRIPSDFTESSRETETPAVTEWCHRRLLARIHRLTLAGLRREIEPVEIDVFMRFLFRHHGLIPGHQRTGSNGLFDTLAMLQGIDIPAICWERDLLPARLEKYEPAQLDELCLTGEIGWGRLNPAKRNPERGKPMASLTRVAPLSIFLREDIDWIVGERTTLDDSDAPLSSPSQQILELLAQRGAMFATDLMSETRMLPGQLKDALGELVTRGFITADGFGGLRNLIAELSHNSRGSRRRNNRLTRRRATSGTTGRWSLWRRLPGETSSGNNPEDIEKANDIEQWAWQLLRRWGVVFRDLLTREPSAPRWFELLQVFRRLEARGEIRGGRFVRGVGGEQFATGETVRQLRKLRDEETSAELVVLSAADPLNLVGILTEHARVPSTAANRVAYHNGEPLAKFQGGDVLPIRENSNTVPPEIAALLRGTRTGFVPIGNLDQKPTRRKSSTEKPNRNDTDTDNKKKKPASKKGPRYPNGIPRPIV